MNNKVLLIYTGGTIGMQKNASGALIPVDFSNISKQIPALQQLGTDIDVISFENPIDSSNVDAPFWQKLAQLILDQYEDYCGFVVLHGTDTMAYSSSVLSYMLQGLHKPVVFTGSQLPIGSLRSDGRANIITSLEIASAAVRNQTIVPEVSVCFEQRLYRGNRVTKHYSDNFDAFKSHNYPALATVGAHISFNKAAIAPAKDKLETFFELDNKLKTIRLHPCMRESKFDKLYGEDIKAIILETYGTGNAPTFPWFLKKIEKAIAEGIIVVNISQCPGGHVDMGVYQTSLSLRKLGVVNGYDLTEEAAITKMMHLLGSYNDTEVIKKKFESNIAGELNPNIYK